MAEKVVTSRSPRVAAIDALGGPQEILHSTHLSLVISKFPKKPTETWGKMENNWVTGLTGVITRKVRKAGIDGMTRDLNPGDPWTIRWDFDEVKGSHVNFEFGKYPQAKICFKAPIPQHEAPSLFYLDIIRDQTNSSGYRHYSTSGTPAERNHGMINTGPGGSGSGHVMTPEERRISEQKQMHESAKQLARHWTSPILVARGEK